MRKILRARSLRPVAWLVTLALLGSPIYLPLQPAQAAGELVPTVAIVQVVNQSGSAVQNLANRAAAALSEKLMSSGNFKVLGQGEVDQAVTDAGVRLPLRADLRDQQLQAIADRLHIDYLLTVGIDSVETDADKQLAVVKSHVDCFSRIAQGDVALVETTAFNIDRSSNEGLLLDDALEQNALYSVRDLYTFLNTTGKILGPPNENTVRVTFTDKEPLRYGSEFVVLQDGLKYATVRLQSIHAAEGECLITQWHQKQVKFHTDDQVQLYRMGKGDAVAPHRDWDPSKDVHAPNEERHKSNTTLWAIVGGVALLALGAWALTSGRETRNDARTPTLVSPPNNSTLLVDTTSNFVNDVAFVATSVRSADQLTLEIASDAGFANVVLTQNEAGTGTGTGGGTEGGEPLSNVTFTVEAGGATTGTGTAIGVFPPGAYFWRVISVSGEGTYRSNTFGFSTVRQGATGGTGGGAFLRSPDSVVALPGNNAVEIQWSPVPNAAGYEVWRRILTPRFANAVSGRTFEPQTGSNQWLRGDARRSPSADRRNRRDSFGSAVGVMGRQVDTASLAGFSRIAEVTAAANSYTDSTVENGTEYQWVILTKDALGNVTPLGEAQGVSFAATTPLGSTPPVTPTNLTAIAGDGQVSLTWSANTEADLAGYEVYRSTSANGNFVAPANLVVDAQSPATQGLSAGPGDVTVVDRGVTNGVTVFYRIRAVQVSALVNNQVRGGLDSPLSDAVQATPSTAPPQELQLVQPPNGSTTDADRPLISWRGVEGAGEYTVQLATNSAFTAGLITFTSTDTEVIYPANLPALAQGTTYFVRVGVFDASQQALRFGPTNTFTRGAVQRFTTTVTATFNGAPQNGARLTIDGADTGEVTPAQFILSPKTGNTAYAITAVFEDTNGTRRSGTVSYRPGIDNAAVVIPLSNVGTAPASPTGLSATGQTDRIVLRWNPDPNLGVGGATVAATYSVRRRSNTEEGPFTEVAQIAAPTTGSPAQVGQLTFTDFNVGQGVRYFYRIVGISGAGVESIPSVTANAVAGVGLIQIITPQDNQTFGVDIQVQQWSASIDFAWVTVPTATRYVFEIGTDPQLNNLLEDGNEVISQSAQPQTTVTLGATAPTNFQWFDDGAANTAALYWRVVAVDENNTILNQTEARRLFINQPGLIATQQP